MQGTASQSASPRSLTGMMGQLLALETISRHAKDKKGIRSHELTQGQVMFAQPNDFLQLSDWLGRGEQWVSL